MSDLPPLDLNSPVESPPPPKGALGIIFLIVFMDLLGFGIIIPLLPLYAVKYQASALQVGLLFSVFSICQFIASPILGAISDKHGRRGVLVYSQLGSAIGYLLLGLVMQIHWSSAALALGLFYLSRLIDGISGGNISTAQAYISDVTTEENRAKGMGVIGAAFGIGFAIGPFLGGVLAIIKPNIFHESLPGYFAALMSLCAMLMTFLRLPESRTHKPAESAVWLHPGQFTPIFRNGRLTQLLLIGFISMAGFVMLEAMAALFFKDTFHWGPLGVGLYFGYLGVVIATVQGGLIGKLTKRYGEWPLAIIGPLFVAVGMSTMVYVGFHPILLILFIGGTINATGRSLQTPTLFSLISKNSDRRQQGAVFGLNMGLSSIARAVAPAVAGILYARHSTGPFALSAVILIVACIWTIGLRGSARESRAVIAPLVPSPGMPGEG